MGFALALGLTGAALSLPACSTPVDGRFTVAAPDRASFPDVAQAMVQHCGSLDCHGNRYRNLRLYGNIGLRWDSKDHPLSPPCTTSAEVDQDFDSVVGLEPEAMNTVAANHGAQPDDLLMIRKARGSESHKGFVVMVPGDDLDNCIVGWLQGQPNKAACQRSGPPTVPPPAAGSPPQCEPGP
jgi:hypothetical protein